MNKIKENDVEIWSWNKSDSDTWTHGAFNSREEAIEDAIGCFEWIKKDLCTDTPMIYLGKCEYIPLRTDLDPDRCMEYCDEMYADDSGCDYYIYEGVSDEDRDWLENKLSDVMKGFNDRIGLKPNWFRVIATEEVDLGEYVNKKQ